MAAMVPYPHPTNNPNCHNIEWKWIKVHQNTFDKMEDVIAQETLFVYLNSSEPFDIHTNVSLYQLKACISQQDCPIAF